LSIFRYCHGGHDASDSADHEVQDPEAAAHDGPPSFLLRLPNDEELTFNFTFIIRQHLAVPSIYNVNSNSTIAPTGLVDTNINGLTFVFASSSRDLENLVTREFHANPNLHKNPQVELVGDYGTDGHSSVQFQWSWKWTPPKTPESRGGGWRTSCSFVEYDQRAHRLETLAGFTFWVQSM
jgi:Arf-GAP/SH3 domain/ANK repeat/PH domain-containing protein